MTRIPSLAALVLAAVAFSPLAQAQYDQPIGQPLDIVIIHAIAGEPRQPRREGVDFP